jgi:hypothetical protein
VSRDARRRIGAITLVAHAKIIHLPSFSTVWETFLTYIRDAFLLDNLIHVVSAPASFDVLYAHGQSAKPVTAVQAPQRKRITYIVLAKMWMPKLAELFLTTG